MRFSLPSEILDGCVCFSIFSSFLLNEHFTSSRGSLLRFYRGAYSAFAGELATFLGESTRSILRYRLTYIIISSRGSVIL